MFFLVQHNFYWKEVWAKNIQNPDFIELLYVFIFIETKYGPKIFKILTLAPFVCLNLGLFGLFFQPEQYFSLTTIQSEQCFSASFSQNSTNRMGPYFKQNPIRETLLKEFKEKLFFKKSDHYQIGHGVSEGSWAMPRILFARFLFRSFDSFE